MTYRFRELPIAIALLAICAFFAIKEPAFLGARNLSMLVTELSITATLAMGMLLILLPGHIDLSAGSGVGLLGGIASASASARRSRRAPSSLSGSAYVFDV